MHNERILLNTHFILSFPLATSGIEMCKNKNGSSSNGRGIKKDHCRYNDLTFWAGP